MPTKRDPTPVSVSKSVICLLTLRGSTFVEYSRLNMRSDFLCFEDSFIGGSIDSQSYIEGWSIGSKLAFSNHASILDSAFETSSTGNLLNSAKIGASLANLSHAG